MDDRLAELLSVDRISEAKLQGALGHANRACRSLDARALEGPHQLLEAVARLAAEQGGVGNLIGIKADLVFLHATIAQDLDLAAAHAGCGEGIGIGAARLRYQEH